jgi:hypothetical protein
MGSASEIVTPPMPGTGRLVIRVATDTCIVFGILYAFPFFLGVGLLREHDILTGLACIAAASAFFGHYALQCIVFDGERMCMRRPFFPGRPFPVREITNVVVTLKRRSGRSYWQMVLSNRGSVMCTFNPRVYSFEGLDALYGRIRSQSPTVEIHDDAYEVWQRGRS